MHYWYVVPVNANHDHRSEFTLPYSREQKQVLLFRKSEIWLFKVSLTKVLFIFCCSKIGKKKWGQSYVNKWLPSLFFANFTATKDEKYFSNIQSQFLYFRQCLLSKTFANGLRVRNGNVAIAGIPIEDCQLNRLLPIHRGT